MRELDVIELEVPGFGEHELEIELSEHVTAAYAKGVPTVHVPKTSRPPLQPPPRRDVRRP